MIKNKTILEVADRLRKAQENKKPCSPIRDLINENDIESAYAVQSINNDFFVSQGAKIVGYKIGLTSEAVRKQFGINEPDFGRLFDNGEIISGSEIPIHEIMQPKVEGEVAFVLKKKLDFGTYDMTNIISAVDYVLVSIEVLGSRIDNWDIRLSDSIADNASASHWVVGKKKVKLETLDLVNCKMKMKKNGIVVSKGSGASCLGTPLNSLLWLSKTFAKFGETMKAGDLILSGAIGQVVDVAQGDYIEVEIEGLGGASLKFT